VQEVSHGGFEAAAQSGSHVEDFAALKSSLAQLALNPRDLNALVSMLVEG
jgi:hypothetical protein